MATYYRWRRRNLNYTPNRIQFSSSSPNIIRLGNGNIGDTATLFRVNSFIQQPLSGVSASENGVRLTTSLSSQFVITGNPQTVQDITGIIGGGGTFALTTDWIIPDPNGENIIQCFSSGSVSIYYDATEENPGVYASISQNVSAWYFEPERVPSDSSATYVYSTNASTYPVDGIQGSYYYDQRTTITSPTAPTNLQYPNPITTPTVTVSWDAATSNVPGVPISYYRVAYRTNPPYESMPEWYSENITATSYELQIPAGTAQIKIWVYAYDSNGNSAFITNGYVPVYLAPTLTAPSLAMQNQPITVTWTAITGATSYTLQRKADTDTDWVQVYSGPNLTFTETVGTWISVQYQVQAVFSSGAGGWATSASIPVVSASALVISGTDEDLGTLTADVPYTVSSDTGNPITLTRTVNGNVVATLTVQSGFAYTIPVMDLPTGSGTIEIFASVTATSGPVSATRTWTYTKTAITFPNSASVGQLNQDGTNIFPATLAEAVRVPTNWGGTLDKALELLYDAANSAVISVGTYEGSGTYGVDNPNTLTISPSPQVVTIYGGGQTLVISSTDTSSPAYIDGTTVKWYSTVSAAEQMNTDGVTYSYVAVAKGVTA